MTSRVVVIGGGLAGLLAARRHAEAGAQVTVLEAGPEAGGAIVSRSVAGVPVSGGAEAYAIGSGAVDALIADLGMSEGTASPREGLSSRIVSGAGVHRALSGAVLGVPSRPLSRDARAILGLPGALRAWLERFLPASSGMRPGVSIGALVAARSGRRVAERLVAPIVGGVHSADPWSLDAETVAPQLVAGLRSGRSLSETVRSLTGAGSGSRSAGANVRSLLPTMAALPERLVQVIEDAGGEVLTGTAAGSIGREDGLWRIETEAGAHEATTHTAETLVLACPPHVAARLLEGAAPEVAAAIPLPTPIPIRLVALVVDCPGLDSLPTGTGALVAPGTPGVRAKALTHISAKWEHVAAAARSAHPEAASPHVLRLSYGRPGETLPGESVLATVGLADASEILGIPLTQRELLGHAVLDWPESMHRSGPGHRADLERLDAQLTDRPDLEILGAWRSGTGIDATVRADAAHRSAAAPPDADSAQNTADTTATARRKDTSA